MQISISDPVLREVLKLQAIEEGRFGNYTNVDESIDKLRYRVNELLMASVLKEIRIQQANPQIGNTNK